jgi:hypothetical protein
MQQKERDFLESLNQLELILKEFVHEAFAKRIDHSAGDRVRFYKFLEEYKQLEAKYHRYKEVNAENKAEESRTFYNSFFNGDTFSPNHK